MINREYFFSYFPCQSCASKVNCEKCAEDVRQGLMKTGLAAVASVDMNEKVIRVEMDPAAEDDVIDHLEGAGVFV